MMKAHYKMSIIPSIGFHTGTGNGSRGVGCVAHFTHTAKCHPDLSALQIFVNSPKSFNPCMWEDDTCDKVQAICKRLGIRLFIHAPYLINPCAWVGGPEEPQIEPVNRIVDLVVNLIQSGAAMGAEGVVLHVGKSLELGEAEGLERMRNYFKAVMDKAERAGLPTCRLLLETCAGQGTEVLRDLDDFGAFVRDLVGRFGPDRIGACVDTCHVYACGYDMDSLYDRLHHSLGWEYIHLIHLNDSATPCGSQVDRHERINWGHIGAAALGRFCLTVGENAPHVAFVFETPHTNDATRGSEMEWFVGLFTGTA